MKTLTFDQPRVVPTSTRYLTLRPMADNWPVKLLDKSLADMYRMYY